MTTRTGDEPQLGGNAQPVTGSEPYLGGQRYFLYVNQCPGGKDFAVLPKGYPNKEEAWSAMKQWFQKQNVKVRMGSSGQYLHFAMIPKPKFIAGTLLWGNAPKLFYHAILKENIHDR